VSGRDPDAVFFDELHVHDTAELERRARELMSIGRSPGPRGFTAATEELEAELGAELDEVIQAEPLANGGPCMGDPCNRGRRKPRRAIWALLDLELCDRCAIRKAKQLDGATGRMAVPKGKVRR
jgi:hypothetical protein